MKVKILKVPKNIKAYGGPTYRHSGNWTNNVVFINEGGLHSENPFEGVMVGVDQEGTPNLVEEGEIIFNDYVFSNRLKPTKKILADGGFPDKYNDWTFAKIAEDLQKESAERPVDIISNNTLNDMMNRLITFQEMVREKKKTKFNANSNRFDLGSWLPYDNSKGFSYYNNGAYDKGYTDWLSSLNYDNNKDLIDKIHSYYNQNIDPDAVGGKDFISTIQKLGQDKKFGAIHRMLGDAYTTKSSKDYANKLAESTINTDLTLPIDTTSNYFSVEIPNYIETIEEDVNEEPLPKIKENKLNLSTLGRYAPVVTNAASLINNIFDKQDTSNIDRLERAAKNLPKGTYTPLGDYINIEPVDRNYLLNPIISSSRATARNIQNTGLNAGQTIAGLLTNNYNTQKAMSEALLQADRENIARSVQEAEFNRGTNQANSSMGLQALAMNQDNAKTFLNTLSTTAQLREAYKAQKAAGISSSASALSEDIAGIATENYWKKQIEENPAFMEYIALMNKAKNRGKCGGMLTRKKRR